MTKRCAPLPGTAEALALGCKCPVYEDKPELRSAWRTYIVSQWCRVHAVDLGLPGGEPTAEDMDHSVVYWYARTLLANSTVDRLERKVEGLDAVLEAARRLRSHANTLKAGEEPPRGQSCTTTRLEHLLDAALAAAEFA